MNWTPLAGRRDPPGAAAVAAVGPARAVAGNEHTTGQAGSGPCRQARAQVAAQDVPADEALALSAAAANQLHVVGQDVREWSLRSGRSLLALNDGMIGPAEAEMLASRARGWYRSDDNEAALAGAQQARTEFLALGQSISATSCLRVMADALEWMDRDEELADILRTHRADLLAADPAAAAATHLSARLGKALSRSGQGAEAIPSLRDAMGGFTANGQPWEAVMPAHRLANEYLQFDRDLEVAEVLEAALPAYLANGEEIAIARTWVLWREDLNEETAAYAAAAETGYGALGDLVGAGRAALRQGKYRNERDTPDAADGHYTRAREWFVRADNEGWISTADEAIADLTDHEDEDPS